MTLLNTTVNEIPLNQIKNSPNSRIGIDTDSLHELMTSIKETGILQPIGLQKRGKSYFPVWGNRRLLACRKLQLKTIRAVVVSTNTSEADILALNLIENLHRKDITPYEQGRYFRVLNEKFKLTYDEIGVKCAISSILVARNIRLFKGLPSQFVKDLPKIHRGGKKRPGDLSPRIAGEIINLAAIARISKGKQEKLYEQAKKRKLTVKQLQQATRYIRHGGKLTAALHHVASGQPITFTFIMDRKKLGALAKRYKKTIEVLLLEKLKRDKDFGPCFMK